MRRLIVITVLCAAAASAEDLGSARQSARTCATLNGLELGRSTFEDLARVLGPAKQYKDHGVAWACYTDPTGATLVWHSDSEGAAYRFFAKYSPGAIPGDDGPPARLHGRCERVKTALRKWTAAGGLRFGMSPDEAQRLLGPPANSDLYYQYFWKGAVMEEDGLDQGLELHFGPHGLEAILAFKYRRE